MQPTLYGPHGRPLQPARAAAPSIITSSKALCHPSAEDRAISSVLDATRGVDVLLPVIIGRQVAGWAMGSHDGRSFFYKCPPGTSRENIAQQLTGVTTYDDVIAAVGAGRRYAQIWSKPMSTAPVANNWYDLWTVAGNPAAGAYGGAAMTAQQKTDQTAGAIYMNGNVEPTYNKLFTGVLGMASAGTPTLLYHDRVLTYEACAFSTGSQNFTNTLPAQRYISAGPGLKVALTGQTVLGATAANITALTYVNQAGTAGQTMPTTPTVTTIISAAAPTATLGARIVGPASSTAGPPWGPFLPLATGDAGVTSLTNVTYSAANTGTLCYVLNHPFCWLPLGTAGLPSLLDMLFQWSGNERIYDGACISAFCYFPAATAATLTGECDAIWN